VYCGMLHGCLVIEMKPFLRRRVDRGRIAAWSPFQALGESQDAGLSGQRVRLGGCFLDAASSCAFFSVERMRDGMNIPGFLLIVRLVCECCCCPNSATVISLLMDVLQGWPAPCPVHNNGLVLLKPPGLTGRVVLPHTDAFPSGPCIAGQK
jgi:hypothetical protein